MFKLNFGLNLFSGDPDGIPEGVVWASTSRAIVNYQHVNRQMFSLHVWLTQDIASSIQVYNGRKRRSTIKDPQFFPKHKNKSYCSIHILWASILNISLSYLHLIIVNVYCIPWRQWIGDSYFSHMVFASSLGRHCEVITRTHDVVISMMSSYISEFVITGHVLIVRTRHTDTALLVRRYGAVTWPWNDKIKKKNHMNQPGIGKLKGKKHATLNFLDSKV